MNKNSRSEEELMAVLKPMEDQLDFSPTSDKAEQLFNKLSPMTQAREKALLGLRVILGGKNLTREELRNAQRKCLTLHSHDVMLAGLTKVVEMADKHPYIPVEFIILNFLQVLKKKRLETSVEVAEIITSLELKDEPTC